MHKSQQIQYKQSWPSFNAYGKGGASEPNIILSGIKLCVEFPLIGVVSERAPVEAPVEMPVEKLDERLDERLDYSISRIGPAKGGRWEVRK